MTDKESQRPARKRPTVSGALGRVLEQVESQGFAPDKRSVPDLGEFRPTTGAPAAPRFFPTKGFATVPASVCRPWVLADRPDNEFGHLAEVARSLKDDGQIQSVVVRVLRDPAHPELRYEVIAGQVRWRAARDAGVDLDISIRELNDEQAFRLMAGENEFRQNLSDYARARRFAKALEMGLYENKASLARSCSIPKSQLSYLLGFAELDPVIVARLRDVTKVSARLGYVLNLAVKEGFREAVLRDLSRIESGDIGRDQIPGVWAQKGNVGDRTGVRLASNSRSSEGRIQYHDQSGRLLFSVRSSSESGPVLRFSKVTQAIIDDTLLDEIRVQVSKRLASAPD